MGDTPAPADGGNAVTRWFGAYFTTLHPRLQALHRQGGSLSGMIDITTGKGVAGWLGRRLARSLGIPTDRSKRGFSVEIRHSDETLHWDRHFDDGSTMRSQFTPIGIWPTEHWQEQSGALTFSLTVDVVDQGWHWRPLGVELYGIQLPMWLFPASRAGKRIEDGQYVFWVDFSLPVVGTILSYGGRLDAYSAD